jgi:hypothetical protein
MLKSLWFKINKFCGKQEEIVAIGLQPFVTASWGKLNGKYLFHDLEQFRRLSRSRFFAFEQHYLSSFPGSAGKRAIAPVTPRDFADHIPALIDYGAWPSNFGRSYVPSGQNNRVQG